MEWQSIAPIDRAGAIMGAAKYSARQQGYSGDKRRQPDGYAGNPRKQENNAADKFLSSDSETMTEFQLLLRKLMKDNERMRKVAGNLSPTAQSERLYTGVQVIRLNGGYVLGTK